MSLFGLGYTHSDLGGFAGGKSFDQELYIRWLQYGVFQPVFRPQAQDNIAPEPIFHDQQTKDILREFVKLRYAMLPYNYSLAYENSLTGMPLMRPVFFEEPTNTALIDVKDSYFWGDAFLVKPITEPNLKTVSMDLPKGIWFDYWNDKKYAGNQVVQLQTQLDTLPVMVRGGSFIPMVQPVQSIDDYSTENLELHYYADESIKLSSSVMYDDDGTDPNAIRNNSFEQLEFSAVHQPKQLTISLKRLGQYQAMPKDRATTLIVHGWTEQTRAILINQKSVFISKDENEFLKADSAAIWSEQANTVKVKFSWSADLEIQIK
jgi:oligosaccharide 4-alpha-D-glucosyltransferase